MSVLLSNLISFTWVKNQEKNQSITEWYGSNVECLCFHEDKVVECFKL